MEYKVGKTYELDNRYVVMMGDYVAVCWNENKNEMYIDFVNLRYDPRYENQWYEDEDSTVPGGISSNVALHISEELIKAHKYIEGDKS
jgi:hypothetical protein